MVPPQKSYGVYFLKVHENRMSTWPLKVLSEYCVEYKNIWMFMCVVSPVFVKGIDGSKFKATRNFDLYFVVLTLR